MSETNAVPVVPSALVQVSVTLSTIAPVKVSGEVIASDEISLVPTVQVPVLEL